MFAYLDPWNPHEDSVTCLANPFLFDIVQVLQAHHSVDLVVDLVSVDVDIVDEFVV